MSCLTFATYLAGATDGSLPSGQVRHCLQASSILSGLHFSLSLSHSLFLSPSSLSLELTQTASALLCVLGRNLTQARPVSLNIIREYTSQ